MPVRDMPVCALPGVRRARGGDRARSGDRLQESLAGVEGEAHRFGMTEGFGEQRRRRRRGSSEEEEE